MKLQDYISGERLAAVADTRWHPGMRIPDPGVVYVKGDYVQAFLKAVSQRECGPYKLITHNSDSHITQDMYDHLPPCIELWLAQNCEAIGDSIVPVPIGLVNSHTIHGCTPIMERALQTKRGRKLAYLCATKGTNQDRPKLYDLFGDKPWVTAEGGNGTKDIKPQAYYERMREHRFVFSPAGAGVDCHRTWEAIAMGAVPIVKRQAGVSCFEGLPILFVDRWDDVTEKMLKGFKVNSKAQNDSRLTVQHYWKLLGKEPPKRRIIAFSLFGTDPKYNRGLLENIRLAQEIYPGWTVRVYHGASVPVLWDLKKTGAETYAMLHSRGLSGTFWRFLAMSSPDVERVIFRDADSRLNVREKAAVDAWIASGLDAHAMHDHRHHTIYPLLAGMWGIKGGVIDNAAELLEQYPKQADLGDDQRFLASKVWPLVESSCLRHSSIPVRWPHEPFPAHPAFDGFVGEIIDVVQSAKRELKEEQAKTTPEPQPAPVQPASKAVPGVIKMRCPSCSGKGMTAGSICQTCSGGGIYRGPVPPGPTRPANDTPGNVEAVHEQEQAMIAKATQAMAGRFLDIGANDGVKGCVTRGLAMSGWRGVMVEPSPAAFMALQKSYGDMRTIELLHAAVVISSNGLVPFWEHENHRLSTTSAERSANSPLKTGYRRYYVHACTLADIDHAFPGGFAFVNIDVEGENLALLKALPVTEWNVQAICVEHQGENERHFMEHARKIGFRCVFRSFENLLLVKA